ncbi:unnamed protein product [Parnassius mnemosyne]|uniref:Uncharacterized protein n=1 Tax=Parnassius mnemosyne TaxID=213953 RepID=A0AAV1L4J9_9NEOP
MTAIVLIQEPWVGAGKIKGLNNLKGEKISRRLGLHAEGRHSSPHDLSRLVNFCERTGLEVLIGTDSNAHYPLWGMERPNERGKDRKLPLSQNVEKLLNVTPDDLDAVLRHYKITPKGLQEIVISIQEWYEKQHHLPQGQLDDKIILQHLILKGFNMEKVKDKIDNFFSAKHKMPEILLKRDPLASDFDRYLRFAFFVILPKKTSINHRVSIFRHWVFQQDSEPAHRAKSTQDWLAAREIDFIRHEDWPSSSPDLNPLDYKIWQHLEEKACSKPHPKLESLKTALIKAAADIDMDLVHEWRNAIQTDAWRTYFSEQDKLISDESKRTRFLSTDDFFGCEGSFKKLEVD